MSDGVTRDPVHANSGAPRQRGRRDRDATLTEDLYGGGRTVLEQVGGAAGLMRSARGAEVSVRDQLRLTPPVILHLSECQLHRRGSR